MDDKRSGADTYILWYADYPSGFLPCLYLHHLCIGISDDRKFVDYNRHHRHRPFGHRQGTGWKRADSRRHHFGSLFRRQDFTVVGYYGTCLVCDGNAAIQPYPIYDDYHRPISSHHPCHFYCNGACTRTNNTQQIAEFTAALDAKFNITPWLLAVPVITGILIARRVPSVITLFLSTLLAGIFAFIFQPGLLNEIAEGGNMFKGIMMTFYGSTSLQTDSDMLTELIATRGMAGMMNTIWLIICAMCFGGAMTASGMLGSITSLFVRFMKNTASMVASTVCSGLFLNLATADQYISIILTGNMFSNVYAKKGYESRLLSRTTEDAVTVTSPLIPWNTCGMTQATILSVPTLTYLPYCFFNLISPVMSIFIAAIGYKIIKKPVNNPG